MLIWSLSGLGSWPGIFCFYAYFLNTISLSHIWGQCYDILKIIFAQITLFRQKNTITCTFKKNPDFCKNRKNSDYNNDLGSPSLIFYLQVNSFLKRLPGVGSEPGSSWFNLFSHFSPLYRSATAAPHQVNSLHNNPTMARAITFPRRTCVRIPRCLGSPSESGTAPAVVEFFE
jgi:hypothetical protein